MSAQEKPRFPRALAIQVAREIVRILTPVCERIIVAGSLRRKKADVGDVEIVFAPRREISFVGLFGEIATRSLADPAIESMIMDGAMEKRKSVVGHESWGPKNKLARHLSTGVPVDLFATDLDAWSNYVVARTGSGRSNVNICKAALQKGWHWRPYDDGFSRITGRGREWHTVDSERDVFDFVGLPYLEPWERE